eukprot:7455466-Pyramimonas_sp.AAC.1
MLGKNVIRTCSSLYTCLAATDHHFAIWRYFWKLIETNQAGPWLAQIPVVVGADTAPNIAKVTFSFKSRSRLEISCHVELIN